MDVQRAARALSAYILLALSLGVVATSPALRATVAAQSAPAHPAGSATTDSFDQLYERGQRVTATIRTLTAQFTETTTSSLLVRPLVARGALAVERPSRVVLHYAEPESRVVLIDNNKMTMTWPSRQVMDVGAAMGRVQRYFVDGSAADLRRQFDIDDKQANDRPGTFRVAMVPRQKRIREALDKLELWVDRESFLLSSMRMTFANGDTKTMTFENVVPNAALPAGTFTIGP